MKETLTMCVANTAKRRRKQLRQTRMSRNRNQTAAKRFDDAKYGSSSTKKKK
jgi:hypothetical protein